MSTPKKAGSTASELKTIQEQNNQIINLLFPVAKWAQKQLDKDIALEMVIKQQEEKIALEAAAKQAEADKKKKVDLKPVK